MHLFDAHISTDRRSYNELKQLVLANVRYGVVFSRNVYRMSTKEVYLEQYDFLLRRERKRCEEAGIYLYCGFGIHPGGIPDDVFDLLDYLPKELGQEGVVALGETGLLDPDSKLEKEILKAQLNTASSLSKPILIHTPHDHKKRVFNRIVKLVDESGIDPSLVCIDHLDPNLSKEASRLGIWSGIALWPPLPFVRPDNFLQALKFDEYDVERTIIGSQLSARSDDPLTLSKLHYTLERNDIPQKTLVKLFYDNPRKFYKIKD